MITKKRTISFNKAGGTAHKAALSPKLSLPNTWLKQMGVTPEDKDVEIIFDGKRIIIEKTIEQTRIGLLKEVLFKRKDSNIVKVCKAKQKLLGIKKYLYQGEEMIQVVGKGEVEEINTLEGTITLYIHQLAMHVYRKDFTGVPKQIKKELECAEQEGILPLYLACVYHTLCWLLEREAEVSVYMGYIEVIKDEQNIQMFHAIPVCNEKIIDVCLPYLLEKNTEDIIVGKYEEEEEGTTFFGWELSGAQYTIQEHIATYTKADPRTVQLVHIDYFRKSMDHLVG